MPSNLTGPQTQPIGLRTLSDLLVNFLKLTTPTATDLSNPTTVNAFTVSATVTGGNPGATVLNQLSLHDLIGLLNCFTFQVQNHAGGSSRTISYTIAGSSPNPGAQLPNGSSFATKVGALCLTDIFSLLPQATFTVAEQGGGSMPWNVNGSVQADTPLNPALGDPVGTFAAKYVFLLLHLFQFKVQNGSGGYINASLDGNKITSE
jgi:hypothetical protein